MSPFTPILLITILSLILLLPPPPQQPTILANHPPLIGTGVIFPFYASTIGPDTNRRTFEIG